MADQFFMTKKGYDEAVARLKYLQTEKRQEVVARIQEARSHGDLSENAEYDAAREEQRAVEGEISELDYKVKNAVIIEENADDSYVHIGCTVKVYDSMFDEECEYEITGSMESDPAVGNTVFHATFQSENLNEIIGIIEESGLVKCTYLNNNQSTDSLSVACIRVTRARS